MKLKNAEYFTESFFVLHIILKYFLRFLFFLFLIIGFGLLVFTYKNKIPVQWNPNVPLLELSTLLISLVIFCYYLPWSRNFGINKMIKKMNLSYDGRTSFLVAMEKVPSRYNFFRQILDKTDDIGVLILSTESFEYSGDHYSFKLPYADIVGIKRVGPCWMGGINNGKKIQILFLKNDGEFSFIFTDRSQKTFIAGAKKNNQIAKRLFKLTIPDIYRKKS